MVWTTLAHQIDLEWLLEAYRRTRKDGAVGIDGQTAKQYAEDLETNLQNLLNEFKSGRYRAPAVRRVEILKGDGKSVRRIGIPSFEDKVLQRAVLMLLEAVYEQDFLDCSYGFRPGRSAHDALEALRDGLMSIGGGFVIDLDIRSFFDEVDIRHLRSFLDLRVRDGVVRRTIDKWLKAGVMEKNEIRSPVKGTPQGGVASPILSNIYLHEVLDKWFDNTVCPRLKGRAFMIRFADDATLCFEREEDARRVMEVLPKRLGRYGLSLHPEKTKLLDFRRPRIGKERDKKPKGLSAPRGFDMLGFTHYWGKSRRGYNVIKRKTSSKSFSRSLKNIAYWCRRHRHEKVAVQHDALCRKLYGHYGYFGITANGQSLWRFRDAVERVWQKWLNRRSSRNHMPWERFKRLLERYPLPPALIVHSAYRSVANP
jgi:group II intron reverse transcriptase/maturase